MTSTIPSLVSVGNHEIPYGYDAFRHRFYLPGHFQEYHGENYFYSFDYGLVHFVVMSTETEAAPYDPGSPSICFF